MTRILLLLLLVVYGLCSAAQAQLMGSMDQDARSAPGAIEALGRAEAVAAVPSASTVFFYNPAHLARLNLLAPKITFFAVQGGVSASLFDKIEFYADDVAPAIDEGLENLSNAELDSLYFDLRDQARTPTSVLAQVQLPSLMLSIPVTPTHRVGVGIGGFVQNHTRAMSSTALVPDLDLYSQTDLTIPLTASAEIPLTGFLPGKGLAVGLTAHYTKRYVALKQKPIDAFDSNETVPVFGASGVGFDVGFHVADLYKGLDVGLVFYNLVGGGMDYSYDQRITFSDEPIDSAPTELDSLEARLDARGRGTGLRAGVAYHLPTELLTATALSNVTVALDVVSSSTSEFDQPFGAKWRLGVSADVLRFLALRAGWRQGYPTFGVGLVTPVARLDYAFHQVEEGRLPGQFGERYHVVQLRFGLF